MILGYQDVVADNGRSTHVSHSTMRPSAITGRVSKPSSSGHFIHLLGRSLFAGNADNAQRGACINPWPHGSTRKITSSDTRPLE